MKINEKANRAVGRLRKRGAIHGEVGPAVVVMAPKIRGVRAPYEDANGTERVLLDIHQEDDGSFVFSGDLVDAINEGLENLKGERDYPEPPDDAGEGTGFDLNDLPPTR